MDKTVKIKQLWCGWYQTRLRLFIERVYAYSEKQAHALICKRIAKKQGVPFGLVWDRFLDKANYRLIIEVEFKEVENG